MNPTSTSEIRGKKRPALAVARSAMAMLILSAVFPAQAGSVKSAASKPKSHDIITAAHAAARPGLTPFQLAEYKIIERSEIGLPQSLYLIPEPMIEAQDRIAEQKFRSQNLAEEYKRTHMIDWILPKKVAEWWPIIQNAGNIYHVDPVLITAVMMQESGGNRNARGSSGDTGLMQVVLKYHPMPKYADPFDPQTNIYAGTKILGYQLGHVFPKNLEFAVASYNIGDSKIERLGHLTLQGNQYINYIIKHLEYIKKHAGKEAVSTDDSIARYMLVHSARLLSEIKRDPAQSFRSNQEASNSYATKKAAVR